MENSHFAGFGVIQSIKKPPGRHCAFIVYQREEDSSRAIEEMNGVALRDQQLHVARGKTQR